MNNMNKFSFADLDVFQHMSLDQKVRKANQLVSSWNEEFDNKTYISISGGKDSQVLYSIIKEQSDVPAVFINTGLEHDSVRKKGMELADKVLYPAMNFKDVLTRFGYPVISKEISGKIYDYRSAKAHGKTSYVEKQLEGTYVSKNGKSNMIDIQKYKYLLDAPFRISNKCCDVMKKAPAKAYEKETGRKPFIGTLAEESMLRTKCWLASGCNSFDTKRPTSRPLSVWTEQDVLRYIKENDIHIAEAYGNIVFTDEDGFEYDNVLFDDSSLPLKTTLAERTGCVFCMYGIAYDTKRFLRLKESEPKKYEYVMNGGEFDSEGYWIPNQDGLGYKFVIDWLNQNGGLKIEY